MLQWKNIARLSSLNKIDVYKRQPLVSVTQNRRLFLRAEVSEKYYPYLRTISSANFQTPYNNQVYELSLIHIFPDHF